MQEHIMEREMQIIQGQGPALQTLVEERKAKDKHCRPSNLQHVPTLTHLQRQAEKAIKAAKAAATEKELRSAAGNGNDREPSEEIEVVEGGAGKGGGRLQVGSAGVSLDAAKQKKKKHGPAVKLEPGRREGRSPTPSARGSSVTAKQSSTEIAEALKDAELVPVAQKLGYIPACFENLSVSAAFNDSKIGNQIFSAC